MENFIIIFLALVWACYAVEFETPSNLRGRSLFGGLSARRNFRRERARIKNSIDLATATRQCLDNCKIDFSNKSERVECKDVCCDNEYGNVYRVRNTDLNQCLGVCNDVNSKRERRQCKDGCYEDEYTSFYRVRNIDLNQCLADCSGISNSIERLQCNADCYDDEYDSVYHDCYGNEYDSVYRVRINDLNQCLDDCDVIRNRFERMTCVDDCDEYFDHSDPSYRCGRSGNVYIDLGSKDGRTTRVTGARVYNNGIGYFANVARTVDLENGSGGWYVDYNIHECVRSCNKNAGLYCGGVAEDYEEEWDTAKGCCDGQLWWLTRWECVPGYTGWI